MHMAALTGFVGQRDDRHSTPACEDALILLQQEGIDAGGQSRALVLCCTQFLFHHRTLAYYRGGQTEDLGMMGCGYFFGLM
jgi:hypothetical protein